VTSSPTLALLHLSYLQALGLSTTDPLFQLQAYSSYFLPKAATWAEGSAQPPFRGLLEQEVERRRQELQVQQQQASAADSSAPSIHEAEEQNLHRHVLRDLILAARDIKFSGSSRHQQGGDPDEDSDCESLSTSSHTTRRSMASSPSSFSPQSSGGAEPQPQRGPTSLSQYLSSSGAVGEVSPSSGGVILPVYFNSYTTSTGQYIYGRSFASTSCFKWKYTDQIKLVQASEA
jgi:hypothetical protein